MIRFHSSSGNVAILKLIARDDVAVVDMEWQREPTSEDVQQGEQFVKESLKPVKIQSLYEQDAEKRGRITREMLGGGQG